MSSDEDYVVIDVGSDSDKVDTDVEEELYSLVHHDSSLLNQTDCTLPNSCSENNDTLNCSDVEVLDILVNGTTYKCTDSSSKHYPTKHLEPMKNNGKIQNYIEAAHHTIEERFKPQSSKLLASTIPHTVTTLKIESSSDSDVPNIKKMSNTQNSNLLACNSSNIVRTIREEYDSDSDALLSPIYEPPNQFCTNVRRINTNILNIDSSSNDSLSANVFNPSIDNYPQVRTPDTWEITLEDGRLDSIEKRRDFMRKKYFCHKCRGSGHTRNFCHGSFKARCYICGGNHPSNHCLKRICGKCHDVGHFSLQCKLFVTLSCTLCNMAGHGSTDCPDLWRRYYLTTDSSKFKVGEKLVQSRPIYCFNCGAKGHFGPSCPSKRSGNLPCSTWPYVISYGMPNLPRIKKKKKAVLKGLMQPENEAFQETAPKQMRKKWRAKFISRNQKKRNQGKERRPRCFGRDVEKALAQKKGTFAGKKQKGGKFQ